MSTAPHHGRVTSNIGQSRVYTVKAGSSSPRARVADFRHHTKPESSTNWSLERIPRDGFATGPVPSSYAHGARASCCTAEEDGDGAGSLFLSPCRSMLDGSLRHCPVRSFGSESGTHDRAARAASIIRLCARLILLSSSGPSRQIKRQTTGPFRRSSLRRCGTDGFADPPPSGSRSGVDHRGEQ